MRVSWRRSRAAWDALVNRAEVTLVCACVALHCHRVVLAEILVKLGGVYRGERAPRVAVALGSAVADAASVSAEPAPWKTQSWLVVDCETSGLDPASDRIIEIALCRVERGAVVATEAWLIDPELASLPPIITELTSLRIEDLVGQPRFSEIAALIAGRIAAAPVVVAYNAPFDRGFVASELSRAGLGLHMGGPAWVDPMVFVKSFDKYEKGKKLTDAAQRRGIATDGAHRAAKDAEMAARLLLALLPRLSDDAATLVAGQELLRAQQETEHQAWRAARA